MPSHEQIFSPLTALKLCSIGRLQLVNLLSPRNFALPENKISIPANASVSAEQ